MKIRKILTAILMVYAIGTYGVHNNLNNSENRECKYGQCNYTKKDGYQCGNCAQQNSYYCWNHNNM